MILLNPVLNKLHIESLPIPNWVVFLETRPFVMRSDAEFAIMSSFPLVFICSMHFPLSCRILLALPTSNNFVQFVFAEIRVESNVGDLFRTVWCWLLLWWAQFIRTGLIWISNFWYLEPCNLVRKVFILYFFFLLVFSVLYTILHWGMHSLADKFGRLTVFLRTEW